MPTWPPAISQEDRDLSQPVLMRYSNDDGLAAEGSGRNGAPDGVELIDAGPATSEVARRFG